MSRVVGPSLPPHLRAGGEDSSEDEGAGPALPPHLRDRLPLQSGLAPAPVKEEEEESSEDDFGPALPPGLKARVSAPPPAEEDSEEEDETWIGPRLGERSEGGGGGSQAAREIEERSRRMREKLEGKDEKVVERDSWMLELPEEKANTFGLGPRTFSRKGIPEKGKNRSKWTDTPEEKARKLALGIGEGQEEEVEEEEGVEQVVSRKRDEAMEKVAEELKVKRGSASLMDIHDKKLSKRKKEDVDEGLVKERRPFDRDLDLQANQFDAAAKKAMLKKAAKINDRFSSGTQKFL